MARQSQIASMSLIEIKGELTRRERSVGALARRHERLLAKIRAVEQQIAELGGGISTGSVSGRSRPRNKMKLVDALAQVLKGKTMSVGDAMEAVQKAGYQTTSPSFRVIVNQSLLSSGRFKRVERGMYTAE